MKVERTAASLFVVIASVFILIYLKDILIPFIIALIIWFIIREVQRLTKRIKIKGKALPVWLRGLLSFAAIFSVLGILTNLLVENIQGITEVIPVYQENLIGVWRQLEPYLGTDAQSQWDQWAGDMDLGSLLSQVINSLTSLIGNAFLIIIYVAFLMLEERHFAEKINALSKDAEGRKRMQNIMAKVDTSLSKYVNLKSLVSLLTGFLSYVALLALDIDFAFFWAFLIFLLNFIPTIGSLIATLFPALIAAVQFADLQHPLYVLLSVGLIQVLVGNVVEPKVMGTSLNISSLVVILSLAFWGSIWGVVGMVLSVPVTVMLMIILAQFDSTRAFAVLLADRSDQL